MYMGTHPLPSKIRRYLYNKYKKKKRYVLVLKNKSYYTNMHTFPVISTVGTPTYMRVYMYSILGRKTYINKIKCS